MPNLITAARDALAYLKREREDLVASYCTPDGEGGYNRASAIGAEADHLDEIEGLIAALDGAISDPYPTNITLDVATAHLCEDATELLNEWSDKEFTASDYRGIELPRVRTHRHLDGWMIRVPWEEEPGEHAEDEADLPTSLREIFAAARAVKAVFINFDVDANKLDGVPLYSKENGTTE